MVTILKPFDFNDCVELIKIKRQEIISGSIRIDIIDYIHTLSKPDLLFLAEHGHAYEFTVYSRDIDVVRCSLEHFSPEELLTTDANWYRHFISPPQLSVFLQKMILHQSSEDKRHAENIKKCANHSNMPQSALEKIITDRHYNAQILIPFIKSPQFLTNLAQNSKYQYIEPIAANRNTPVEVLKELARNGSSYVRIQVASNPNTPNNIAEHIINDTEMGEYDRNQIAENPNTPLNRLEYLWEHYKKDCKDAIASNPNTSSTILENSQYFEGNLYGYNPKLQRNPNTPHHILEKIVRNEHHPEQSSGVAANPNAPAYILEMIYNRNRTNFSTNLPMIENPSTPISLLEKIAVTAHSESVKLSLAQSPRSNDKILNILSKGSS
jgi:hypothetical protein